MNVIASFLTAILIRSTEEWKNGKEKIIENAMRDKDGFIIPCKYTEWKIIDNRDNKDFVCMNERLSLEHFCYGDENCRYYVPDVKGDKK